VANRIILDAATATAWSHWTALGVNGVVPPPDTAVDPEPLILLTAVVADDEPRLRDEASDWCVQFGSRFVAAGRMRTLAAGLDEEGASRFQTFAATINAVGGTRWYSGSARPRRLSPSGKSRLNNLDTPTRALLRLRCAFGTSARAEILLTMLTQWDPGRYVVASELVELGYSKNAIATTLDDLALAGLAHRRSIGNAFGYQLRSPGELRSVLEPLPLRQRHWHVRLLLLARAVQLEESIGRKPALVQSVEARKFVDLNKDQLARLGLAAPSAAPRDYWAKIQAWLAEALGD
jgi:hypothetical protein